MLVLLVVVFLLPSVALALPSSELWESYTAGNDSNYEVYGNIWLGQSFTISPESHSVLQVRLRIYREGSPGTVTVSIQETSAGLPVGDDLTSGTIDGDILTDDTGGAWYGVTLTETSLSYDEVYSVVIRAEAGDGNNSLHIVYDGSAGAYAGGSEVNSSNGGVSWAADTDDDLLFEVRGCALLEVDRVNVFRGYAEDDDMLFTIGYYNVYEPYYPGTSASTYFLLQLRSTNGSAVIAQTVCKTWGYKPGAIYLSADECSGLDPGGAYRIYIYGDLAETPDDYYTLDDSDWRGDNLELLDEWALTLAHSMEDYYAMEFVSVVASGEVLNEEGCSIFATGIPALPFYRPGIFQTVVYIPGYDPETWTNDFDDVTTWDAQLGPGIAAAMTNLGSIFGIDGRMASGFALAGAYILVALIIAGFGDAVIAVILVIPFILLGSWLRVIDFAFVAVTGSVAVLLLVYRIWWSRT